jgi:multicomponent Na+:H+ antiporter subunit E
VIGPLLSPIGPLLTVAFRLGIWLLLTSDRRTVNVLIGLAVALLLPMQRHRRLPLRPLASATLAMVAAIPVAFSQALRLIVTQQPREGLERLPGQGRSSSLLMFLEVFTITITPFSICLGMDRGTRHYLVHTLTPGRAR